MLDPDLWSEFLLIVNFPEVFQPHITVGVSIHIGSNKLQRLIHQILERNGCDFQTVSVICAGPENKSRPRFVVHYRWVPAVLFVVFLHRDPAWTCTNTQLWLSAPPRGVSGSLKPSPGMCPCSSGSGWPLACLTLWAGIHVSGTALKSSSTFHVKPEDHNSPRWKRSHIAAIFWGWSWGTFATSVRTLILSEPFLRLFVGFPVEPSPEVRAP